MREARASVRRLGVYMGTITLGVAAVVAISGYRANALRSVNEEARNLLGADLRLSSGRPMPDSVRAVLDSVAAAGVPVSDVVSTVTVALGPTDRTRLVQLRAITGDYPYYGNVDTEPAGRWRVLRERGSTLVEPAVLAALDAQVGDTIRIGALWLRVAGTTPNLPPEFGFRSAIGPRVFIGGGDLEATGLIQFGSLVRHEAFLAYDEAAALERFVDRNHRIFRGNDVRFETAAEQAEELGEAIDWLGRFLGLVGLMALLLGGLGVASAVHVFVADRRPTVAVLRCLGARQRTTFSAYLLQAALLGLAGATAGAALGVLVQLLLPVVLAGTLPFQTTFRLEPLPIIAGIVTGMWVAVVFALLPLLEIRNVTPLAALRYEVEPAGKRRDPLRVLAFLALLASIATLAIWQAPSTRDGLGFAAGIGLTLFLLWVAARLTIALARRLVPRRASFSVRQGVASLFRPHNQTTAVTMALGFGVFLVMSIWTVQFNLVGALRPDSPEAQPNLVAFDIQPDQLQGVQTILERNGGESATAVPIVTARIAELEGIPIRDILYTRESRRVQPWAVRREYRNTYRDTLTSSETLVAGEWWSGPREDGTPARISIEQDVAGDLDVGLGDRITWDVQGVRIETVVTSLRAVDWARFETNFFVVFEPGVLETAPQNIVLVTRIPDDAARSAAQRDVVIDYPNVSLIDVATVQATIERIVGRATLAIRFMAFFSIIAGAVVLAGAVSASRFQRMRESVLLRTLGATRAQVRRILLTEYATLGLLGGAVGTLLGTVAGWLLVTQAFDMDFRLPLLPVAVALLGVAALAALIGLVNGGEALRRTPLAVLREADS